MTTDVQPEAAHPNLGVHLVKSFLDGSVCCLVLDRPECLNCINEAMVILLNNALDNIEASPEVKVVVIAGEGRGFCSGADLREALERERNPGAEEASALFHGSISSLFTRIEDFPLPVIAAIDGIAVAGGLELALCCDLVVAGNQASFADGHIRYNLIPGGGASVRLPRKIGANRASEMLMTGSTYDALTMRDWGLVNKLAASGTAKAAAIDLANRIACGGRETIVRLKQLSRASAVLGRDVALQNEQSVCRSHHTSTERIEGLAAFSTRKQTVSLETTVSGQLSSAARDSDR